MCIEMELSFTVCLQRCLPLGLCILHTTMTLWTDNHYVATLMQSSVVLQLQASLETSVSETSGGNLHTSQPDRTKKAKQVDIGT